ncbi:hypothetical protein C7459_1024 [Tumebacillus permanentifrigoris]|uniref:Uncharacterized protein n=1 Tax=Tumebacillus permanentifrigoris TaxID=378543 RepID=A0A316DCQ1_9BACL|nr:hypothetical protein C7459_1024 [Tumebacillus permanentifrigoris]
MKRKLVLGLLLVVVAGIALGKTTITYNAGTMPPEPWGIISNK